MVEALRRDYANTTAMVHESGGALIAGERFPTVRLWRGEASDDLNGKYDGVKLPIRTIRRRTSTRQVVGRLALVWRTPPRRHCGCHVAAANRAQARNTATVADRFDLRFAPIGDSAASDSGCKQNGGAR